MSLRRSARCATYLRTLRADVLSLTRAMRRTHPSQLRTTDVELSMGPHRSVPLSEVLGY